MRICNGNDIGTGDGTTTTVAEESDLNYRCVNCVQSQTCVVAASFFCSRMIWPFLYLPMRRDIIAPLLFYLSMRRDIIAPLCTFYWVPIGGNLLRTHS